MPLYNPPRQDKIFNVSVCNSKISCIFAEVKFKLKIMATIVLDYDARNMQAKKALEYILSLGVFRSQILKRNHKITFTDFGLKAPANYKFDREEANAR